MAADYRWDNFRLDLDGYRLERDGAPVPLEPKAFNLLALMVRRPDHLFSKQELFEAVWPGTAVTDHALTRVIAQLRRALGDEAREGRYIVTVPTRGYRWIRPVAQIERPVAGTPNGPPTGATPIQAPLPPAAITPSRRWGSGLGAIAAAIALAGFVIWMQQPAATPERRLEGAGAAAGWQAGAPVRPVQLTTNAGLDFDPAIAPHGDRLAYVSDRSGGFEVYLRALGDTASDSPLTNDGGQNVQPAWSPDGRQIAYHSNRFGGIWIVPAGGGTARHIAASGSNPDWSPDGTRIAFQSDENNDVTPSAYGAQAGSTLWTVDVADGRLRQVTRGGRPMGGHSGPAWSRDGRYLAFTVFDGGTDDGAWLVTMASGAIKPIAIGAPLYDVAFAAGDTSLYAAGGDAFVVQLPFDAATGTVRGARHVIAVPGVPGVRGLSIAADGARLAFAGLALSSQIWSQPIDDDGNGRGPAAPITSDTSRRNSFAVVSPDGAKVAYMSTRAGEMPDVWVMDIDGGNRVQVTADKGGEARPAWFPDGRRVAYASYNGESRGLFAVDIHTRLNEPLFDLAPAPPKADSARLQGRVAELQVAPSITQAAFALVTRPESRRVIYVTGLDSFEPRALTDPSRSIGYPAWSPDERHIAVEIKDGSSTHAGVIDVESGALRQLTRDRGQTWVRSWSSDGRRIAVATLRDGLWGLRWIDVQTGATGTIVPPAPPHVYVRYPEWSSANNRVVFERGELRGNIWTSRDRGPGIRDRAERIPDPA